MPNFTPPRNLRLSNTLRWTAILCGVLTPLLSYSADCPTPLRCAARAEAPCDELDPRNDPNRVPPTTGEATLSADRTEYLPNGDVRYHGNVEARQGDRVLRAEEVEVSQEKQEIRVPGAVELADPNLIVRGEGAKAEAGGAAQFDRAQFELPARAGHGSAERIRLSANGEIDLRDVRYTTCPLPKPTWELRVGSLHIDQQAHTGSGTGARVDFKGVPILYTPYISFPVGNEPKSGLLFPEFGQSTRSGVQLSVPYYWRIAPNYDATFTPTYFSLRGLDLGSEFRFLTEGSKGQINFNFLPNDRETNTDRTYALVSEQTEFTSRLRFNADAVNLGDRAWFEDFSGATYTSLVALPRSASLQYRGDEWSIGVLAQNFQIIDPQIPRSARPYTLLPRVYAEGFFPDRWLGLTTSFYADLSAFERNAEVGPYDRVQRLDAEPQLRLPLRADGIFLEPAVGYRYIAYHVDTANAASSTPTVGAPIFSVDGGMILERESGNSHPRIQTLEPRFLYAYIPYRNQDDLPSMLFDTSVPDFNLVQLFETNRYAGADRIGDIDHIALGLTSRLIDAGNGRQFLSATIGELYRFQSERVGLPGEVLPDRGSSDVIGELTLSAYQYWSAHLGVQWDPATSRNERTEVGFQFRPDGGKVVNVAYRYRRDNSLASTINATQGARPGIEQIDTSAAWSIGASWSLYGRVVYSLKDGAAVDRFGGFEYRACCWGVRVMARRTGSITGRSGWDYKAQLELNGLANVGHPVDTFLAESIQGYSAARNDYRSTP